MVPLSDSGSGSSSFGAILRSSLMSASASTMASMRGLTAFSSVAFSVFFLILLLVELGEGNFGRLLHLFHDPPADIERGNKDDEHSDEQADQRQDQSNAQFLDVLSEAHRDHRLLFSEEIFIVCHGRVPPEMREEVARKASTERTRGLQRPVPRPEPFKRRRLSASLGRPIERGRSYWKELTILLRFEGRGTLEVGAGSAAIRATT